MHYVYTVEFLGVIKGIGKKLEDELAGMAEGEKVDFTFTLATLCGKKKTCRRNPIKKRETCN